MTEVIRKDVTYKSKWNNSHGQHREVWSGKRDICIHAWVIMESQNYYNLLLYQELGFKAWKWTSWFFWSRNRVPEREREASNSWKSIANDEDVGDVVDENAAQSWTRRCVHIVGMRQQKLGQLFSPCGPDACPGFAGDSSNTWTPLWTASRQTLRSVAREGMPQAPRDTFKQSLYRLSGRPVFRVPQASSEKKTIFGRRLSSIRTTCPAHRSW